MSQKIEFISFPERELLVGALAVIELNIIVCKFLNDRLLAAEITADDHNVQEIN